MSNVVDKATQEKIDVVKSRLIRNYGYKKQCDRQALYQRKYQSNPNSPRRHRGDDSFGTTAVIHPRRRGKPILTEPRPDSVCCYKRLDRETLCRRCGRMIR